MYDLLVDMHHILVMHLLLIDLHEGVHGEHEGSEHIVYVLLIGGCGLS